MKKKKHHIKNHAAKGGFAVSRNKEHMSIIGKAGRAKQLAEKNKGVA